MANSIGVVRDLNCSLAARAELALIDWMLWIAFQLFCKPHFCDAEFPVADHFGIAFDHTKRKTAARGAEGANARFPNRDSRDKLLFWDKPDQAMLGIAAAGQCHAGSGQCRKFYELAAVHISNGR